MEISKKKKKNIFKRKTGRKKNCFYWWVLSSQLKSFLSLVNACWWPVCVARSRKRRGKPASHTDRHQTHSYPTHVLRHTQECLLVIPNPTITACRNQFKKKNNFKKDKKINDWEKKHFFLTFGPAWNNKRKKKKKHHHRFPLLLFSFFLPCLKTVGLGLWIIAWHSKRKKK